MHEYTYFCANVATLTLNTTSHCLALILHPIAHPLAVLKARQWDVVRVATLAQNYVYSFNAALE